MTDKKSESAVASIGEEKKIKFDLVNELRNEIRKKDGNPQGMIDDNREALRRESLDNIKKLLTFLIDKSEFWTLLHFFEAVNPLSKGPGSSILMSHPGDERSFVKLTTPGNGPGELERIAQEVTLLSSDKAKTAATLMALGADWYNPAGKSSIYDAKDAKLAHLRKKFDNFFDSAAKPQAFMDFMDLLTELLVYAEAHKLYSAMLTISTMPRQYTVIVKKREETPEEKQQEEMKRRGIAPTIGGFDALAGVYQRPFGLTTSGFQGGSDDDPVVDARQRTLVRDLTPQHMAPAPTELVGDQLTQLPETAREQKARMLGEQAQIAREVKRAEVAKLLPSETPKYNLIVLLAPEEKISDSKRVISLRELPDKKMMIAYGYENGIPTARQIDEANTKEIMDIFAINRLIVTVAFDNPQTPDQFSGFRINNVKRTSLSNGFDEVMPDLDGHPTQYKRILGENKFEEVTTEVTQLFYKVLKLSGYGYDPNQAFMMRTNILDSRGLSLLHHAAARGDAEGVRFLVERLGLDPKMKSCPDGEDGETPAAFALRCSLNNPGLPNVLTYLAKKTGETAEVNSYLALKLSNFKHNEGTEPSKTEKELTTPTRQSPPPDDKKAISALIQAKKPPLQLSPVEAFVLKLLLGKSSNPTLLDRPGVAQGKLAKLDTDSWEKILDHLKRETVKDVEKCKAYVRTKITNLEKDELALGSKDSSIPQPPS